MIIKYLKKFIQFFVESHIKATLGFFYYFILCLILLPIIVGLGYVVIGPIVLFVEFLGAKPGTSIVVAFIIVFTIAFLFSIYQYLRDEDSQIKLKEDVKKAGGWDEYMKKEYSKDINSIPELNKQIEDYPNDYSLYYKRGLLKKYTVDALKDYDKAIQLNPLYTNAYLYRAVCKERIKDYYGAIFDYTEVIKLSKDSDIDLSGAAYEGRGRCKYELGDKEGALKDGLKRQASNKKFTDMIKNKYGV